MHRITHRCQQQSPTALAAMPTGVTQDDRMPAIALSQSRVTYDSVDNSVHTLLNMSRAATVLSAQR